MPASVASLRIAFFFDAARREFLDVLFLAVERLGLTECEGVVLSGSIAVVGLALLGRRRRDVVLF